MHRAGPVKVLAPAPAHGLAQRYATALLLDEPNARVVAFRLDPFQVVPEHHSPSTVIIVVLEGEGTFTGATGEARLGAGQSAAYEPGEPHAIRAHDVALSFLAVITPRPL